MSNTLDGLFCRVALRQALQQGVPTVFNTDQGAQFTADEFTGILEEADVRISMDGRGRALDNVFVERLWRTVKYEHVYLHNPSHADHRFRCMPSTGSGACRPAVPTHGVHFLVVAGIGGRLASELVDGMFRNPNELPGFRERSGAG